MLPALGWLEVHPENYFGGGVDRHYLSKLARHYPLSMHAVGLSLGSAHGIDEGHLFKIKELVDLFDPFLFSDHASWSASGNAHLNDLLPLPYTQESLQIFCANIDRVQDVLGRTILIENPSSYVAFQGNEMNEPAFLNEAARRTGCGVLLDLNNIYVQAHNHGIDARAYIDAIVPEAVGEMHLAGHSKRAVEGGVLLIDTHNSAVCDDVWDLYRHAVRRFGRVPTLIEWDQDFPKISVLLAEAARAEAILQDEARDAAA